MSSCRDRAAERAETKCSQWKEQGTGSSPLIMIHDMDAPPFEEAPQEDQPGMKPNLGPQGRNRERGEKMYRLLMGALLLFPWSLAIYIAFGSFCATRKRAIANRTGRET